MNLRHSGSVEEMQNTVKCSSSGLKQEDIKKGHFDNCATKNVVTNLSIPYDFNSIMHYSLKG